MHKGRVKKHQDITVIISFGGSCVILNLSWGLCGEEAEGKTQQRTREGDQNREREKEIRCYHTWWWGPPDPQASSSLETKQGHIVPPYSPESPSHEDSLCANTQYNTLNHWNDLWGELEIPEGEQELERITEYVPTCRPLLVCCQGIWKTHTLWPHNTTYTIDMDTWYKAQKRRD